MAGVGDPYHSDSSVSDGDLVHSSSDEEFFHGHSVGGYMFEPEYNEAEYAQAQAAVERNEAATEDRRGDTSWCKCTVCVVMPTSMECLCCSEFDEAKPLLDMVKWTSGIPRTEEQLSHLPECPATHSHWMVT